jgi:hypothetical protein
MQTITAICTIIIASIVAWISRQQWIINREKFRLDLYNRRFEVYVAALEYYRALFVEPEGREIKDIQAAFVKAYREARFLFPDELDVLSLLGEFQKRANEILSFADPNNKNMLSGMDSLQKIQIGERHTQNIKWMDESLPKLEEKIAPYLNFRGYKEKR